MTSIDFDGRTTCSDILTPGRPANVLVLGSALEAAVDETCTDLLSGGNPACQNVLLVTVLQSPDQRIDVLRRRAGDRPGPLAVVGVGNGTRSTAAVTDDGTGMTAETSSEDGAVSVPLGNIRTAFVSDPGDLTGIGIEIGEALSAWNSEDNGPRLCFHTLTALLQYVDLQRVFRFVHVLTRKIEAANGHGHFHLDPAAVDDRTLATVRSLFDAVLEYEGGGWTTETIGR